MACPSWCSTLEDKIQEVLTLMQPFPAQRKGLLKREE